MKLDVEQQQTVQPRELHNYIDELLNYEDGTKVFIVGHPRDEHYHFASVVGEQLTNHPASTLTYCLPQQQELPLHRRLHRLGYDDVSPRVTTTTLPYNDYFHPSIRSIVAVHPHGPWDTAAWEFASEWILPMDFNDRCKILQLLEIQDIDTRPYMAAPRESLL